MKKKHTEAAVGAFVILGFVLLSLVVFFVSGVSLVRSGYQIKVVYNYVSILDRGAPVRMAGVRVGEVSRVNLLEDKETGQTRVEVQVFIAKGFEIRENYKFSVRGTHILSEPHIEISPQPGKAPFLKEGDTVQGLDPVPVEVLVEQADQIANHLEAILSRFRSAIEDEKMGKALRETTQNLDAVTGSLKQILGGSEEEISQGLKGLSASTKALETILGKIERGEGTVGKLLSEEELYEEMRDFVKEIKAHPWRLLKRDDKKK